MFLKKLVCFLVCFLLCINIVSVGAARTGEEETAFVEFKALYPDDLVDPVEITLKEKDTGYVLNYYLYNINNYFSNVAVPVGSYSVTATVTSNDENVFKYVYDKELVVESSAVAKEFVIIVDNAQTGASEDDEAEIVSTLNSLFGDEEQSNFTETEELDNNTSEINSVNSSSTDSSTDNENTTTNSKSGHGSIIVSFCISVFIIIVAALVAWFIKKRN